VTRALLLLVAMFDWRSLAVLRRNALVFLRNWRTAFVPPALEPVVFFLAFGLGLGSYVGSMTHADRTVSYATWVAPGLLAYTAFGTPFFEGLYSSYVRMFYQKTWDGILATQVEIHHVVWGEILWAGMRGMFNATLVTIVIGVFQVLGVIDIHWELLPVLPLIALAAGWTFGAFALIFTAIVPAIDHMNYPVFLVGVPIGLISNTYFPVETENPWLEAIIYANPVYHLSETCRSLLVSGHPDVHALWLLGTAGGLLLAFALLAHWLVRRRVLGA